MRFCSLLLIAPLSACMTVLPYEQVVLDTAQTQTGGQVAGAGPDAYASVGSESFAVVLNDERGELSLMPVVSDDRLVQAAQDHAEDMVDQDYLSHTGLNGSTPADRVLAVGYDYGFVAENIAQGFYSEEAVMEAWMNSPGHADNILDERAEDFGLGLEGDTWVLLLGAER